MKLLCRKKNIAYDTRLEETLDDIKLRMWINEELQIQPKSQRRTILKAYSRLNE